MRRSWGKLSHPAIGHTSRKAIFLSSFDFSASTGSDGGGGSSGGRGRGRGSGLPKFSFIDSSPEKSEETSPEGESSFPSPLGHGRGKPLTPSPNIPQFASFGAPGPNRGIVVGRGRGTVPPPGPPPSQSEENSRPKTPMFFRKDGEVLLPPKAPTQDQSMNQEKSNIPSSILSVLSSAGHGHPTQPTTRVASEKVEEVNRHLKPRQQPMQPRRVSPKMSREEAVNKARDVLLRSGDSGAREDGGGGGTQGRFRGVGTRGGGGGGRGQRGGLSGRGRGRGRRGTAYRDDDDEDDEDEEETKADNVNNEKLAKYLGTEKMDLLVQAFEEASANVLPSLEEDAHVDAMHTNLLLECEPEYLMAEFDSNPDIDEKPPIPLRDALEKMKPFLMTYEDIQTEKEWQAVVEETMKNVPLMKELVDYYSGPNKVTAKKQGEELERVAKTLPASAPSSVKRFTDRAVLSLKSNPGWGFDKKCQFMDKLAWEVSQSYK